MEDDTAAILLSLKKVKTKRKCSHCDAVGHNSRTCGKYGARMSFAEGLTDEEKEKLRSRYPLWTYK